MTEVVIVQFRRRDVLQRSGVMAALAGAGLLAGRDARAADDELASGAVSMPEALRALGGIPAVDREIVLTLPDLAENGAVVPVTVESHLPGTRDIFIVVEANPNPMVVRFTFPEGTEPFVSTRIKMAQTSQVYAVVRAEGRLYAARRETQVIVGGCG